MSGNFDPDDKPGSSAAMDNDDDDVVRVISESTDNQELGSREVNYDSNNSNEDGVMVGTDNNGSSGESDGVMVSEDAGREDLFEDAPEDLGGDGRDSSANFSEDHGSTDGDEEHRSRFRGLDNDMQNDYMVVEMERLRAMLDKTINEKESIARECKDEMEMAAKGIANLRDQVRDLINKQMPLDHSTVDRINKDSEHVPLHEMIHECSTYLRSVSEEMQDLNRKSTEVTVSHEVVNSYLNSVQNESAEVQLQKHQYMEEVTDRMLNSLASVVYVGDLADSSVTGKITHVERSVYTLIENYNWFLYQSDQLRQCLTEVRPDLAEQSDYGLIFAAGNDELRGFRSKEAGFIEKLTHFEEENGKLVEQLDKHKAVADAATLELERLKAELEQEKHRYSNTKEKLSMAVTKGKALVQQRDSLKQALAEKTSVLEKCLATLKEKSSELEAAELIKEELVKSQIFGASLQEMVAQKDIILEKLEDIVSQSGVPEVLRLKDITERIRWLLDERDALKDVSLKFHQLADVLLSIDLPENFSFSDLESRLGWLTESFDQAKSEIGILQDEISRTRESLYQAKAEIGALQDENNIMRETAQNEMGLLTAVLSTVLVEKDYFSMELEDLSRKFEALVQSEHQVSLEKKEMLTFLLEASGVTVAGEELPKALELVENCLATVKEGSSSGHESSAVKDELLQNLQVSLYVKDQDLALYKNLLDEEMQKNKTEVNRLLADIRKGSEEVAMLNGEKETLKKDLERAEDKNSLIREKLSMAVKKGKGLVQERENLKQLIDEKSSEIEKLKLELQQKDLAINDYESETSTLSSKVQGIAKLEEDLLFLKEQRDQLQRDLLESNNLLHTLMGSINGIVLPENSIVEEPVEKLKWLAVYLTECQTAKVQAEQQLEKTTAEVEMLTAKVSEGDSIIKSLQDTLAVAEEKISQLAVGKSELEVGHASLQEQLQRALEEASMIAETDAAKKSLENALSLAEAEISRLDKEKEEAEDRKAAAEAEVSEARAEITDLSGKLSEAMANVKDLEDKVSQSETRIALLHAENHEAQIGSTNMENELKQLKEEADTWDSKLQGAHSTIKSLEEALAKAENDISELSNGRKAAEQELSTLNAKLNACMEELAGTHGSLESRSLELFDHLKNLEMLGKDESSILSSLKNGCEIKIESLKEMDHLFRNIRGQFADLNPGNLPVSEETSHITELLSTSIDAIVGADSVSTDADTQGADEISLYVQKIVENFNTRRRFSAEKVDGFLSFLDQCNASVLQELQSVSNMITPVVENMNSQNQKMRKLESDYQMLGTKLNTLEDDIALLLTACAEATQVLQLEVDQRLPEVNSSPDFGLEYESKFGTGKHGEAVGNLQLAAKKICCVCEMLEKSRNMLSSKTEELLSNLNELKVTAEKATEERGKYSDKVHVLETDLSAQQNLCSELRLTLDFQDLEINLRNRETEIASLKSTLMMKEQEAAEAVFWASHLKSLLERANTIRLPLEDSSAENLEPQDSVRVRKLMHVVDGFPELQYQIESLTSEKDNLQTALAAQLSEIEHLKVQVQEGMKHGQELAEVKGKAMDMEAGLERIIQRFATGGRSEDWNSVSTNNLVQALENLIMTVIMESENWKSRAHELELEAENNIRSEQELAKIRSQLLDLEAGMRRIIENLGGNITGDQKPVATENLVQLLEKMVDAFLLESQNLKSQARELDLQGGKNLKMEQEFAEVKGQLFELESGIQRIIQKFKGDVAADLKPIVTGDLLQLLERIAMAKIMESEKSKSKVHELDSKLLASQKAVDELSLKVKMLEDSLQSRAVPPEVVQERSIFEAPSQPSVSEISEIEDVGSVSKPTISPVPSSAHVRTMWKGSSDHIALNIESESSRLIDHEEAVEDKGHVFKSLNASGLVPKQGKMIADRIDGIWVSSDRLLRSRPEARLGLVAYWLFLHIWLLGTIL